MKIVAKKVAEALGVSTATVSLALNNKPGVNEKTRKKILDYIEILKKNEGIPPEESKEIIKMIFYVKDGRMFLEDDKELFSVSHQEVYRVVSNYGYSLEIIYVHNEDEVKEIVKSSMGDDTVGLFIYGDRISEKEMRLFAMMEIPFIVFDSDFPGAKFDNILIHNKQGIQEGLLYLKAKGHQEVMFIHNSYELFNFIDRRKAFMQYASEMGMGKERSGMLEIGSRMEEIYENMISYIRHKGFLPSAIFTENYAVTIGVVRALQTCGYRIPEDISVIGFDKLPEVALLGIKMTYFDVLHARRANIATRRLIEKIKGKHKEHVQILVGVELVEGESVKEIR